MIYPFICQNCEIYVELCMSMADYEKNRLNIECEACGKNMQRVYSVPDFYVTMGACGNQSTGYYDPIYHYCEGNTSYRNKGSRK